jgi:type IV pilus assembly protein PilB
MAGENENMFEPPDWSKFVFMQSVSLQNVTIPPAIIEMVPESVARENVVIPLSQENGVLRIVVHDPSDIDTLQKLQFILNKAIQPVLAPKEQIVEAINRHYGLE